VVRGVFYCSFQPLWEGYDEWSHFAVIDRMVTTGRALIDRRERVSCEVQQSLELAPVPWELRTMPSPPVTPLVTEDAYWHLSHEERQKRQKRLRQTAGEALRRPCESAPYIYEALQAPLYYWLATIPYRLANRAPLADRVIMLRYGGVAIASLAVPLVFILAMRVTGSTTASLAAAALMSAMPELMVDVCRVGNECLGIVIYSWLTLLCTGLPRAEPDRKTAFQCGLAVGLGLLTKAYFLTAVPAVGAIYVWRICRGSPKRPLLCDAAITAGLATAIAAWWYIRNYLTTATWSGLAESVQLRRCPLGQLVVAIRRVD
jgi:hypothetical protein